MKVIIIYDSFFGNTQKVAGALAVSLKADNQVQVENVKDFNPEQLSGVGLLIVGSPTRGFRPTPAIAEMLKSLPNGALKGIKAAAFDTRMAVKEINNKFLTFMVKLFGYAAEPIAKGLKVKGAEIVAPGEGFFVKDREGPLKDGELERAKAWACGLA